jgi:hypothetical protein
MTLPGGTLTPVTRAGDTIRRATGFWSPSVHALLRHLEDFPGSPRFLGIDEQGREILTFLPGEVTERDHPAGLARRVRVWHVDHRGSGRWGLLVA